MSHHHISYIADTLPSKKGAHRLLCVGLDLQIVSHILPEAEDAGFLLDIHKNLPAAQQAISSTLYDLYIVDSSLPQEELVSFIEYIRKQEIKRSIIALVVDHQERFSCSRLQEDKNVDYTLHKHNIEKEIKLLFRDINERALQGSIAHQKSDKSSTAPSRDPSSPGSLSLAYKPLLFVVDQDSHFLELLERMKKNFWINLVVESDPNKAKERLKQQEFTPDGIIVSQTFPSSSITGLDLLAALKEKSNCLLPISAILLERDTLDDRLQAIAKEVNYTFSKPVSISLLLGTMMNAMQINAAAAKVLIIDENINFCHFIAAALEEIGVSCSATQEPAELYNKLEKFNPNILFLSCALHKHKALDLVHVLRRDVMYRNIIIVLIASGDDIEAKINAYHEGVDYVFFKPIHHKLLQEQLLSIVHHRLATPGIHNYTSFFELQELQEELTKCVKKSERHNSFLVLFQADELPAGVYGSISARELTVFIDNQLQWEINDHMKYFWSKEGQFALIFEDVELADIENKVYQFLSGIIKQQQTTPLSFSCSIVAISEKFFNGIQVLKEAEKILSDIRKNAYRQDAVIKISCYKEEKNEAKEKKEVMIIDSNRDLLKILKRAFESHGIIVNTYDEGGHALQELQTRGENHLPSLIIAERKLLDMDGIELCYKLKKLFHTPIPFFILTVFSSDQDIQEGIKSHVLEYIVKPFNISLLIQKALEVIFGGDQ